MKLSDAELWAAIMGIFFRGAGLCAISAMLLAAAYHMPPPWKRGIRRVIYAVIIALWMFTPIRAHAYIVTCADAANILSDYAANWRDKGYPLKAALADLNGANRHHLVGEIQMDRLRYDLQGIYEFPILRTLTPKEVKQSFTISCPREYAP